MSIRRGEAGELLNGFVVSLTPANITAPNVNTQTGTDPRLIGSQRIVATLDGAPGANLQVVQAWITNSATGAFSVQFAAIGGNFATAAQSVFIQVID